MIYLVLTVGVSGFVVSCFRGTTSAICFLSFRLFLGVLPDFDHTLVVAVHAIYALTGFRENKLVNSIATNFAFEAVGVIRVVTGHDSFIENREMTNIAAIGAIGTYWRAIGEEEEISVCCDLVPAFGALEAVDVKERLAAGDEQCGYQERRDLPKGNDEPALLVNDRILAPWTEPVLQGERVWGL